MSFDATLISEVRATIQTFLEREARLQETHDLLVEPLASWARWADAAIWKSTTSWDPQVSVQRFDILSVDPESAVADVHATIQTTLLDGLMREQKDGWQARGLFKLERRGDRWLIADFPRASGKPASRAVTFLEHPGTEAAGLTVQPLAVDRSSGLTLYIAAAGDAASQVGAMYFLWRRFRWLDERLAGVTIGELDGTEARRIGAALFPLGRNQRSPQRLDAICAAWLQEAKTWLKFPMTVELGAEESG